MLEENKSVLDKPNIIKREQIAEPIKKSKKWIFKLILVLIIIGLVYYLFTHPNLIRDPVNNFLGNLLE